ncbi:MAG: hypothetical protein IKS35_04890 [Clostridia bacterium]|nr:hypothetical protein [Clostridia bacterium]
MNIKEFFHVSEFKRYDEFQKQPAEQYRPKELDSIDVDETLKDVPESSVQPGSKGADAAGGRGRRNAADDRQDATRHSGENTGGSQGTATANATGAKSAAMRIRAMTHQVAESVGGLATGIAATVCAAVIAVTMLTNYTAPAPEVSNVFIEPGRYDVTVAADVRNLNEEQEYEIQVLRGEDIVESVPIDRGLEEAAKAYFENLKPGSRYQMRIVGDNGAVGGYITYYSAFFDTVSEDKPYARLDYSIFSPEWEPFAEIEYGLDIEEGTTPAEKYEVYLIRPDGTSEPMSVEDPYTEEGRTYIRGFFSTETEGDHVLELRCTWNGHPLDVGRWTLPVTFGQKDHPPVEEPVQLVEFNISEKNESLYFSGRLSEPGHSLILDMTFYYGEEYSQYSMEPSVEPDGAFFCEAPVDPDAETYGYVLYVLLDNGDRSLLTSGDRRPLDRQYPEYTATYDRVSPDEAVIEAADNGFRVSLQTDFYTEDERFAYRVWFLDADGNEVGFYEGQDTVAWTTMEDLSAWTAVRYESIGIFSTTIIYDEEYLERHDPEAGLSVGESLTHLNFFLDAAPYTQFFDPEFVAHVTVRTANGETEYPIALTLPDGQSVDPDAVLALPYDAVSYSYRLLGNGLNGERRVYEQTDNVALSLDRTVYGASFEKLSADELRGMYKVSPDGSFTFQTGFSAEDPCFSYRIILFDGYGETVTSYAGSDAAVTLSPDRDFTTVLYESVGQFTEEHLYASEPSTAYIPQGTLSATESTNMLSFAGSVGPVPMPEGSELRLSLTLHGTTDTVTEEILTPDAQGQFNCSIKVHYEDTAYSCTLTHINRYGTVTGLSYLDHIGLTADRSYAASYETVTADAALELQAESADGSIHLNTGFSSQDPTFLYRVALADENGTVVTSYTGTDPEVVLKPDKEWSQLIYYSLGDYVNEYVYAKRVSLAYVGEATVHVAESVAELLFSVEMNLQEADYEPVIRLQVTRHGASDDTEVMDLELEQNGTFSVPVALDYDTTAYSYVLQYSSPTGAFVTLASEDHTALTVSHEYGATYTQISADNVAATLFEGEVTIQTGFTGTSDVFGYRVELQDENGETVASYTGTDPVVTLQPGKAWTRIVYTDIGQFRTEHVYGSMSYLTFKGQLLSHEESETAATLTLSGKTNLKDSTYGSQLSMDLTLIGAGSEDLHFDLTLDEDGSYSVTQRLDYETLSYAYTLYFTTASGERVAFYESGTKDLTASRSYAASFTEHTADELEALQGSSSSISFDTAFFTADEAFYYTVTLLDEDGQPVAAYSGRDASVTLTPTGGWVSVRYEKFGEFRTPHSYGSQTYTVFEGTVSNASVSETVNTVTLTGKTNLKEAAFDSALSLELRLKSNGWTTVNAVPALNADGSYSFTANLDYEHTAYAYTLYYTSASGMQKVLLEVPETALTVSHDYGAQYQTLTADQADALQNGSSLTLNTGFSSSDPAFVYRILLKDEGQNVVASYQGTAASVTLTPTGEWTTIVFESVGLFASEHVYSSESSNKFSGSVSGLSASDTANTLTLSGKASFPQPGTVEQISIRLTLIGGAGAVIEDTIPLGQDGSFTYSAMVAQDTVKYKYELFYLNTVQQTKTL